MARRQSQRAAHRRPRVRDVEIGQIRGETVEVELPRDAGHLEERLQLAAERKVDAAFFRSA